MVFCIIAFKLLCEHGSSIHQSNALVYFPGLSKSMLSYEELRRLRDEENKRNEKENSDTHVYPVDYPVTLSELVDQRKPRIAASVEYASQSTEDCSEVRRHELKKKQIGNQEGDGSFEAKQND